jgi:ABC-type bacteriocin/lantibiotic exporter with double-glycine peptidase domain
LQLNSIGCSSTKLFSGVQIYRHQEDVVIIVVAVVVVGVVGVVVVVVVSVVEVGALMAMTIFSHKLSKQSISSAKRRNGHLSESINSFQDVFFSKNHSKY